MKSYKTVSYSFFAALTLHQAYLYAAPDPKIKSFFSEFESNSKEVMNRIPEKHSQDGTLLTDTKFEGSDIQNNDFLDQKDELRNNIVKQQNNSKFKTKAEYLSHDNFRNLLDDPNSFLDKLDEIDTRNLSSAKVTHQPWSGSYWPSFRGGVTNRYTDQRLNSFTDFNSVYYYLVHQSPASSFVSYNYTDGLSPAEKYDLLMNDTAFTLTNSILHKFKQRHAYNKIQFWEGICDGWAVGSYMYKRPVRPITVSNASGTQIKFYPDDIKALVSLLWTNFQKNTQIVGGRCNDKHPATDMNGRLISQECFESNPATVHLALVNQVGLNHKSFVFDASYDYQVWNQPIVGYKYRYFNVQNKTVHDTSAAAKIPLYQYYYDPFRRYRSYKAVSVVGVELTLNYVVETAPNHSETDSTQNDRVVSVTYYYDLELDKHGRAIGGEWYQNAHPDFLWTARASDFTFNALEGIEAQWAYNYRNFIWNESPRSPAPEWTAYSRDYAAKRGVPLDHVIKNLAAWASENSTDELPENCTQPCVPNRYNWHN